jgi:hypothetical protein
MVKELTYSTILIIYNKISEKQQKSNKYETVMKNGNGKQAYNELTGGREEMNQ